uniref:DNA-directed RNA polymerase n=1 Tax=viral metagenome TaxID=1070528 RepID=A0A6C0BMB2_9ZZZZ
MSLTEALDRSIHDPNFWNDQGGQRYTPLAKIKNVQLTLLSAEQIRKMSVCRVTKTTLYEKSLPRAGSINDIRMGTTDRKLMCGTCYNNMINCNGHPGHMELAAPVYHVGYISYLLKLLRCLCPHCYRCIEESPQTEAIYKRFAEDPKQRFLAITSHLKNKKQCQHRDCKKYLPKYSQSSLVLKREWIGKSKQYLPQPVLTPQLVLDQLDLVDDDVYEKLGIHGHPRNFIITTLLVPPPIMRPSIMFSESSRTRGQDDLTLKLQEILKLSNKLDDNSADKSLLEKLQWEVATYMNHDGNGIKAPTKKHSGLPEKCIMQRFKGKGGRVRGNLMGKRVNFSSRTVISPGCHIDVDEIGVPLFVAMKLTVTEVVQGHNLTRLTRRVETGHDDIMGAKSITDNKGVTTRLEFCKKWPQVRLQIGWKVERYLQEGDYVLFNRQPSLRKKSLMAHRVKIWSGRTFLLNLACTGTYNGKFFSNAVVFFNYCCF